MATNPGSYGTAGGVTSAPTTTTPPTTPVAQGTFPQTPQNDGLGVNGISVANISVNQFLSDFDISSTEESTFVTQGTNGTPTLNQNALYLMQYQAMDATERQIYQEAMVNAGLLPATDATGVYNTASVTAFKNAISNATDQGIEVTVYLQQYEGTNNVNTALAAATGAAEKEAQAPVTESLENPTTLAQDATNAFNQATGLSATQAQINAFIAQIQGQDATVAQAPHVAAEDELAQLKSDQSALTKLGPDGIDAIITAYTNAIHGINPNAGNTANVQGPATGTALPPTAPNNPNPSGQEAGPAGVRRSTSTVNQGLVGEALSLFGIGHPTRQATTTTPTGGAMRPAPEPSPSAPGAVPTYGGFFAMTPADWTEAQKLTPAAQKYKTAGSAPLAIQQSAFTALLQNTYDNNGGSWADAIVTIAKGDGVTKPGVLGSNTNVNSFATNIANQVNTQLENLANQVNTQNVTVKTTAPDATAEASQFAKDSDPVQYYSANYAGWGSFLTKMLYGTPLTEMPSATDTFNGPVGAVTTEAGSAAPIPGGTGGAAPTTQNAPAPASVAA